MGRRPKDAAMDTYDKAITQNQSINITKALVKGLGEGDKININYQPIMIVHDTNPSASTSNLNEIQELMWILLDRLPPPKMDNLHKLAMSTCLKKIQSTTKVAEYFGFQRTYVSRLKSELGKDPLFQTIESKAIPEEVP
jgi:hypothetical protein